MVQITDALKPDKDITKHHECLCFERFLWNWSVFCIFLEWFQWADL